MRFDRLSKDVAGAVNVLLIVLIGVLMVSASTVVIVLYQGGQSEGSSSDLVTVGQTIQVDYIGKLTDGRVFDTSNYSIAINDAAYPKTLSFTLRDQTSYTQLSFEVGGGQLIAGFDSAVVGMRIGETKAVTLTSDEAYGPMDLAKLVTFDLTETVPLLETFTSAQFTAEYGVGPVAGLTVTDPSWDWPVTVLEYNTQSDRVVVKNTPTVDTEYHINGDSTTGWDVLVTDIDSTSDLITLEHQLVDADSDYIMGVDGTGTFFITQVDVENGTAVKNYNSELLGKSLVFIITIFAILE
ncbi:MAG TPA: FKBP-type peptidyl-prolyl cis-trans isomerase [Methanomassiliicoccales archaeon]|nr:FKBP-type peptidyl-prolyl cis-trans isomerase [Methanomassiliicoccales archaeon]